jgi:hypothetical protein
MVTEVLLDERHDDLGEELDFSARLFETVPSSEVVGRAKDLHRGRGRVEVHDQPIQEVVGEAIVRIFGGPIAVRVPLRLVQVVTLVLDVLEKFLTSFAILFLFSIGQKVVGNQVQINRAPSGIAKSSDTAEGLT